MPLRGDHDRLGAQPAVHEPAGVRVGDAVGDLDRQLRPRGARSSAARPSRRAATVPSGTRRRDTTRPSCSPTSNSVVTFGCDSAISDARLRRSATPRPRHPAVKSAGSSRTATVRPSRVSRARNSSPGPGGLEPFEQVVVRDDADRRRSGVAHPALSGSITLCSSSFASPICSSTSAMSSVGLPGHARALAVDAVLAHHRQRVGQQVERHRQAARAAPIIVSCSFELRRGACRIRTSVSSALPAAAATAGSRRGSAGCAPGCAIRSAIDLRHVLGLQLPLDLVARRRPPKPVSHRARQHVRDADAVVPDFLHQRLGERVQRRPSRRSRRRRRRTDLCGDRLLMLMIQPPPRARRCGSAARQQ